MRLDLLADMACEAAKAGKLVEVELADWTRPAGFPFPAKRGSANDPMWAWRPEVLVEYVRVQRGGKPTTEPGTPQ